MTITRKRRQQKEKASKTVVRWHDELLRVFVKIERKMLITAVILIVLLPSATLGALGAIRADLCFVKVPGSIRLANIRTNESYYRA